MQDGTSIFRRRPGGGDGRKLAGAADLVLVAVDASAPAPLTWASRGGALFPHLYGVLSLDAVRWVKPLRSAAMAAMTSELAP